MRVMWVTGLLLFVGCSTYDDWFREGYVVCGKVELNIFSDPQNCGGCPGEAGRRVCAEGVACIEGVCDYSTVTHCGDEGRRCVGEGPMACVAVPEGVDVEMPAHGPVLNGFACAPVGEGDGGAEGDAGVGDAGVGDEQGGAERASELPGWVFVPGESDECRGGDPARCHFDRIEVTDICGDKCEGIPFDYNLLFMRTEMSRAHYRKAVCDCGYIETEECADVCTRRGPEVDRLPMTGLNWCMAQAACEALGARLPTAVERARIDEMIAEALGFAPSSGCGDWRRAVESRPQLAECLDGDAGRELVAVDDPRGAVAVGLVPVLIHHAFGNVAEWLLDEPARMRCAELESESTQMRVPAGWEGLRLIQGRSVMSPMGDDEFRPIGVSPSTRAADLGVRCVKTIGESALLDELPPVDILCEPAPVGVRPMRRGSMEPVYRAVEACAVSRAPTAPGMRYLDVLAEQLIGAEAPLAWRDGDDDQIGQAWFEQDAQWWIGEPARLGEVMTYEFQPDRPIALQWTASTQDVSTICADRMLSGYPDQDGYLLRQIELALERDQLEWAFSAQGDAVRAACAHLECVQSLVDGGCEASCPAWRLPFVVGFERVEPFDHPDVCR